MSSIEDGYCFPKPPMSDKMPIHPDPMETRFGPCYVNEPTPSSFAAPTLLACAVQLLKVAACPNCDGSGGIAVQTQSRQLVTREMAMDAGSPEMEGSLYSDDEWEHQQCQWCAEKAQVVSAYEAQANAALSQAETTQKDDHAK